MMHRFKEWLCDSCVDMCVRCLRLDLDPFSVDDSALPHVVATSFEWIVQVPEGGPPQPAEQDNHFDSGIVSKVNSENDGQYSGVVQSPWI